MTKSVNPDIRIIVEIPTFPYDSELKTPKRYLALLKDRKYRRLVAPYVDRFADLSGNSAIFGVQTVEFINGINLGRLQKRNPSLIDDDRIDVMFVAFFSEWHGADRFLRGLADYYRNGGRKNIVLRMAGDGNVMDGLKRIVIENGLEDHVRFLGRLGQNELDQLYDKCSLAVASLGLHRIGIERSSTLKSREYLAKGIPFIYSGSIDAFDNEPCELCFQVPADESNVDIHAVIEFHDNLYAKRGEQDVVNDIRGYATRNVGMDAAMSNVIEYISNI